MKILQEKLKEAGLDIAAASVQRNWNPKASDYAAIAPMCTELLS